MANTEIVEIVSYLKQITPHVKIIIRTNGGIGGVKRYKELSELIGKNGMLVFSVDGWEDTNEIYRKHNPSTNHMVALFGASGLFKYRIQYVEKKLACKV